MRILLVTQYFYPENFKSNDIAFELVKRGHEVDALVGIPNYPEGKYYQGYGIFKKRHEVVNGVNIYRVFQVPRGNKMWFLPINYFSYVLSASLSVLFRFVWKKYDCVIGHTTSPIFQSYPAILIKTIKKIPFYNWILDLWPPTIMNNQNTILKRLAVKIVEKQVRFIYRRCDRVLVSSKRFTSHVIKYGGDKNRITYFPNWSDDMSLSKSSSCVDDLRLPPGFVIMMAGNLGVSQDLETVSKLIIETRNIPNLLWVFVGDGSKKPWLDKFIADNNLSERCFAIGRKPYSDMPYYLSKADAFIISLGAGSEQLDSVVPARLQSYMSAGKPILGLIGKGGADVIEESQCGYSVPSGDYLSMASIINKVVQDPQGFVSMGQQGRLFYEKHFTKEICINHLCDIINKSENEKCLQNTL